MAALLNYHSYTNWIKMVIDEEESIKNNVICFGFELEVTQDADISYYTYESQNHTPEQLAERLKREFGNLFVYERDGSIGYGIEIISQPMSLKYYHANINKFKKLFSICEEFGYVSTKGGKCGLHIHFSRSAFGFTNEIYQKYINEIGETKTKKIEKIRVDKTIENICLILETYREEFIKISGRRQSQMSWCRFETDDNNIINIKRQVKKKKKSGGSHHERYKVVNTTNNNTVEIRLCRGTLLWESFHTRILLIYHLVDIARNYTGLISFKKIIEWKESEKNLEIIKDYIENNRIQNKRIVIDDVKKKVALTLDTEFRAVNEAFIGK